MLQSHLRKQRLEKPKCLWACAMTFQSRCLWNGCFKDRVYSYSQTGAFSVTFAWQHSDKEAVRQNQVGSYMQSLCDVCDTAINCDELMKITNLLSPYIDIHIRAHPEPESEREFQTFLHWQYCVCLLYPWHPLIAIAMLVFWKWIQWKTAGSDRGTKGHCKLRLAILMLLAKLLYPVLSSGLVQYSYFTKWTSYFIH